MPGSTVAGHRVPLVQTSNKPAEGSAQVFANISMGVQPVTLEALMAKLEAIHRLLLEDRRRSAPLSRDDRDRLARMLPAIGATFGSEWFLVRELFLSQAAAVRLVLRGLNAKQVGRLLRRGEGQPVDGYLVERGASELNAILWRVMHVD